MRKLFLFVVIISFVSATVGFTHKLYYNDVYNVVQENENYPSETEPSDYYDDNSQYGDEEEEIYDDEFDDDMLYEEDYYDQVDEDEDDEIQFDDDESMLIEESDDNAQYGEQDIDNQDIDDYNIDDQSKVMSADTSLESGDEEDQKLKVPGGNVKNEANANDKKKLLRH